MTRAQELLNLLEGCLRIALSRDDDGERIHTALGYVEELDRLLRYQNVTQVAGPIQPPSTEGLTVVTFNAKSGRSERSEAENDVTEEVRTALETVTQWTMRVSRITEAPMGPVPVGKTDDMGHIRTIALMAARLRRSNDDYPSNAEKEDRVAVEAAQRLYDATYYAIRPEQVAPVSQAEGEST